MIEPIDSEAQQCVLEQTEYFMFEAERVFGRKFERIPVLFDLRGTTAGMYKVHGKRRWIRYNPWIFAKYFEANWRDTVPHEVAHYIIDTVFGRRAKPHGVEWKALMARFEADPGVTFKLDLTGIPKRQQRTHPYQCLCQLHQVSTTRHNRVIRGRGRYHCMNCEGELVYAG
ncbi:MAG: SprT-like domain-containing protein [Halioglobus sp.]